MEKKKLTLTLLALTTTATLHAQNVQYKYQDTGNGVYKCVNQTGQEGFNQDHLGECGDVSKRKFDSPSLHRSVSGLRAEETEFHSADFSKSTFIDSTFKNSHLRKADFKSTFVWYVTFAGADLTRFTAQGSRFGQVSFSEADLRYSNWYQTAITEARFDRAKLKSAWFTSSLLRDINFRQADLRYADFGYTRLEWIDFEGANLRGANFKGASLGSQINWKNARYNSYTQLPFSYEEAAQLGMVRD